MRSTEPVRGIPHAVLVAWVAISIAAAQHTFVERAAELGLVHEVLAGLDRIGNTDHIYDWAQTGVALGDIDGDGDVDVVSCGGLLPARVFRNEDGQFVDVTAVAGVGADQLDRAVALGDYDRDGDLDLWIGALEGGEGPALGRDRLYRNDGAGRFEDVTALSGTDGAGHSIHGQWADPDRDGWLDLYVSQFHGTRNLFYRNNGDGTFTEVGAELRADAPGSTHVTGVMDTDDDGCDDLFVGNDFIVSDSVGMSGNAGDRELHCAAGQRYQDVTAGSGNDHDRAIMGLAFADFDYDGRIDLYKADGGANHLMINHGWPGSGVPWSEEQDVFGIAVAQVPDIVQGGFGTAVSWAVLPADFDHDRWLDLFVANGHIAGLSPIANANPRFQQNYFFQGLGAEAGFAFSDATPRSGLMANVDDRAAATADMDGDGDLDIVVVATSGALRYYQNAIDGSERGWLQVRPRCRTSAPGCPGTRVERTDAEGFLHLRVLGGNAPTASQSDESRAHFGLGAEATSDLTVRFPSGIVRELTEVPARTVVDVDEPLLVELSPRVVPVRRPGETRLVTATAYAHDVGGEPLDGSAVVTIEIEGLVPDSGVLHVEANRFQRRFLVPTVAGRYRASVSFDGFELGIQPSLQVVGNVSASGSRVRVEPEAVRAGSSDTFTVTVVAKDAGGVSVGGGLDLGVSIPGATLLDGADLGDGRYRFELRAPVTPGLRQGDVTLGSDVVAPGRVPIEVGDRGEVDRTEVYEERPHALHSAAPDLLKLRVIPRDRQGLRLGPGASLSVEVDPDGDSVPVELVEPFPLAHPDGSFVIVLRRASGAPAGSATGRLRVFADGDEVVDRSYAF